MMKKIKMLVFLMMVFVFITGAVWSAPKTATRSVNELLSAADVIKVSGLTGAKLIPKNPGIGAGGALNFATADRKLIVMVQVENKSQYIGYKKYFFKAAVKGLGDEAMQGATVPNSPSNLVAFTKGTNCVALTVFGDQNNPGKNMLTIEQTIELAKIIVSRIGDTASWDWGN
jgi:hypothetical protein